MKTLWIGDSHLEAMTPTIRDLAGAAGWSGSIVAHQGWTTGRWMREGGLAALAAANRPDVVVVLLGSNDDPPSPAGAQQLLAQAAPAKVIWIGAFHTRAGDAPLAAVVPIYLSGVDLAAGLPKKADGVHLASGEAYAALAGRIVDAVDGKLRGSLRRLLIALGIAATVLVALAVVAGDKPQPWETPVRRRRAR